MQAAFKLYAAWLLAGLIALVIIAALSSDAIAQIGSGYNLSWSTIDGGGGQSSAGDYSLHGSIGQSDAHFGLSGGGYTLSGGFWNIQPNQASPTPQVTQTVPTSSPAKLYLPVIRR